MLILMFFLIWGPHHVSLLLFFCLGGMTLFLLGAAWEDTSIFSLASSILLGREWYETLALAGQMA